MPSFPYTYIVSPEQSKPVFGFEPPHVYFTPK